MSASRPGSSRFSMTTMTSGISTLPRLTIRSICSFTVRMTASISTSELGRLRFSDLVDPHGIVRLGLDVFLRSVAFESPWTRILIRSSGSLSMRMMMPTVPMAWMSSGAGFSTSSAFCVARKIMRLPASAASIALIDISRPTNSGSTI